MQMREKVGKSRSTVSFQWFVAPEGRKVGSLKRRVRSQLARWEMKKCTPLWREAHFEVKMYKTHHVRTIFGHSELVSRGRRKGLCTLPKVSKTWGVLWHCQLQPPLHHTTLQYTTLQLQLHLHYIPLHSTTLHSATPTTLHYSTLNYTHTTRHYITLHSTTLHYITLHYLPLHYITLHYTTSHYNYNYTTLHYTPLH